MELYIYKGQADLPSIDFECLRTAAYVKITNAPVTINSEGNPLFSPDWFLPYLSVHEKRFCGFDAIVDELKRQGFEPNGKSMQNQNNIDAYTCLQMKNLFPCLQYYLWGDPQNLDATRSLYARRMRFPLNFIFPHRYVARTKSLIEVVGNFSIDDKIDEHNISDILLIAKKTLNQLQSNIKGKQSFTGEYNEIDATFYAFLAIFYHMPIVSNPLKSHINESPDLVKYVNNFHKTFMKDLPVVPNAVSGNDTTTRTKSGLIESDDDKYYARLMPKIFAVTVAAFAMTAFALRKGIFQISPSNDTIGIMYDDDDDDDVDVNDDGL